MKPDVSNRLVQMLLLAMFATSGCAPGEPPQRPNVVVILLDTLRPDYLGFYGYEKETAPFLARLASESVVFERAFSTSSWTAPSTSSLFTSLYRQPVGLHGRTSPLFLFLHFALDRVEVLIQLLDTCEDGT